MLFCEIQHLNASITRRTRQRVFFSFFFFLKTVKNRDKKLRENLQAHPHTPSRKVAGLIIHIFSKFVKTPSGKKQQLGWRIALRQGH